MDKPQPATKDELIPVADAEGTIFTVPRRHFEAIKKVIPGLRFSLEHLGGKHRGFVGAEQKNEK